MSVLQLPLGWTLLHSLWEGALVAGILALLLFFFPSPRIRYAGACTALLLILCGFLATLLAILSGSGGSGPQPLRNTGLVTWQSAAVAGLFHSAASPWSAIVPWLAPFWAAGVSILYLRYFAGWYAVSRLRRRGVCLAPNLWVSKMQRLATLAGVTRGVQLLESCLAEAPMVLGHLRPVILVPAGLLAGLPADQLEAVLLHELAHIVRSDYLANVLQQLTECLFFYHPCVWWISRVIRDEREHCCDDLVVATSGDAYRYALALASLEEYRASSRQPVLAASGGNLMKRIRRLLYPRHTNPTGSPVAAVIGLVALSIMGAMTAWQPPPARAGQETSNSTYLKWLNQDVVYIIEDAERAAFLSLTTGPERDHFIEQFWLRRDPTPGTPENEFKIEHYRRIGYVNEHFAGPGTAGWQSDRGHVYIVYGPPDELESHPRGGPNEYPHDDWLYHHTEQFGDNHVFRFVDRTLRGDYRLE